MWGTKFNLGPFFYYSRMIEYDIYGDQIGGTLWDIDYEFWIIPVIWKIQWSRLGVERR